MRITKPMLAEKSDGLGLEYPLIASPKLDGVRALVLGGKLLSRSFKPIPNGPIQHRYGIRELEGMDGELIVGSATEPGVLHRTTSAAMSRTRILPPEQITYNVFDLHCLDKGFAERYTMLGQEVLRLNHKFGMKYGLRLVEHQIVYKEAELMALEQRWLEEGYEGVMLRKMHGPYKCGRSTLNEGYLLKLKRMEDAEAEVIGYEEKLHNLNEATVGELGQTKRSTKKSGMVGADTLGALRVRDVRSGVEFSIGIFRNVKAEELAQWWKERKKLIGKLVKYQHFPYSMKDKPNLPVFLAFRSRLDL